MMSILEEANEIVGGSRKVDYTPEHEGLVSKAAQSFTLAVELFNSWTGLSLTEEHGAQFMMALKMSRFRGGFKKDHLVDLVGYASMLNDICEAREHEANITKDDDSDAIVESLLKALKTTDFNALNPTKDGDWSSYKTLVQAIRAERKRQFNTVPKVFVKDIMCAPLLENSLKEHAELNAKLNDGTITNC